MCVLSTNEKTERKNSESKKSLRQDHELHEMQRMMSLNGKKKRF